MVLSIVLEAYVLMIHVKIKIFPIHNIMECNRAEAITDQWSI
jgi:hypothetical protein